MRGTSNWYRNTVANPCVTLGISGKAIEARGEPVAVNRPEKLQRVLDIYRRERPGAFENFFGISLDVPIDELMGIGKYIAFMRLSPIQ